ncbi:uncharacterized protein PFL1_05581 [Pseudozyma flocculosa PF-1]|nr:uncharacterized protein PFL1_05581 [Pseudozyma flocculosa PF-1]EPQ26947.1 hypothetical protein PFL1_05581 [Pseudozyma flocculosa PF-1]
MSPRRAPCALVGLLILLVLLGRHVRAPDVNPEPLSDAFWEELVAGHPVVDGFEDLLSSGSSSGAKRPWEDPDAVEVVSSSRPAAHRSATLDVVDPPRPAKVPHTPNLDTNLVRKDGQSSAQPAWTLSAWSTVWLMLHSTPPAELEILRELKGAPHSDPDRPWLYFYTHPTAFSQDPEHRLAGRIDLRESTQARARSRFAAKPEERTLVLLKYLSDLRYYDTGISSLGARPYWMPLDQPRPFFDRQRILRETRTTIRRGFTARGALTPYVVNGDTLVAFRDLSLRSTARGDDELIYLYVSAHMYPLDVDSPVIELGILATPFRTYGRSLFHPREVLVGL